MKALITLIILLLGFSWFAEGRRSSNIPDSNIAGTQAEDPKILQQATLIKVVDGDTIVVSVNRENEVVRILGIDTPEVDDATKTVGCLGKQATKMAKSILINNKIVFLEADPTQGDRDKYQRLLRYVWIGDGKADFGKLMIVSGYASEYTYNLSYKHQSEYKQVEQEARSAKKGLWADDECR